MTNVNASYNAAMGKTPNTIMCDKLILGEGVDEANFFEALLPARGMAGFQIEDYGGKDELENTLRALPGRRDWSKVKSVSIFRDSDGDWDDALAKCINAISNAGHTPPTDHGKFSGGTPRMGIFLLPGRKYAGSMLEDLCLASVSGKSELVCVEDYLRCVWNCAHRMPKNLSKARVMLYSTGFEVPVANAGLASMKGYFPFGSCVFDEITGFLDVA